MCHLTSQSSFFTTIFFAKSKRTELLTSGPRSPEEFFAFPGSEIYKSYHWHSNLFSFEISFNSEN